MQNLTKVQFYPLIVKISINIKKLFPPLFCHATATAASDDAIMAKIQKSN